LRDRGRVLLMASHQGPQNLLFQLPDLQSRMLGSLVFYITTLRDENKKEALKMRANNRGMEMSEEVANYIMTRAPRSSSELFRFLALLDVDSIRMKRKLTVPFVKDEIVRFSQWDDVSSQGPVS